LTLNRAELSGLLSSSAYWSNTSNWSKAYLYYSDSTKKQTISLTYEKGNVALFSPSGRVKQSRWTLEKIIIRDYDRGLTTLNRSKYFSAFIECDIVVSVPNRTPSDIFLSNTSPLENQTFVGNLTATDPDIEDPLVYSVVAGFGDAASFQVVGSNALHFVAAPNFEVKNQYSVKIRVTDSSDTFYEEAFTINVVDANDAPTNIALSANTINENLSINTVIGTLSASDEDAGASHTFSIVGGDTNSFNINGNQLRSSEVFNHEAKASYSVTVRATDNGGLTYDKSLNISVLNVNETPTGIALSNNTISEYVAVNTVVGVLTTTDPDGGDTFTYSLIGGDTSLFNINGNQLRSSAIFDWEGVNSYSLTVRSTDAGGLQTQATFSINIANVSEAPTDIALSANTINENAAVNTVIGTLSATAPTLQSVSYSLVGGDVGSFNLNGNQLRSSASFDFETKSSYSITVRGSAGGETFDKVFSIGVNNIAEAPTNILLSSQTIAENNAINAVIGTLSAVGDECVYTIISATSPTSGSTSYVSRFNINGNQLRASVSFDRENIASYTLQIRATTSLGLTYSKNFSITIDDINDNEPFGIHAEPVTLGHNSAFKDFAPGAIFRYIGVRDKDFYSYDAVYGQHEIEIGTGDGYPNGYIILTYGYPNTSTSYVASTIVLNMNDQQTSPFLLVKLANGTWALQKNPNQPINYLARNGDADVYLAMFWLKVYNTPSLSYTQRQVQTSMWYV
jgi:hypothetical protein